MLGLYGACLWAPRQGILGLYVACKWVPRQGILGLYVACLWALCQVILGLSIWLTPYTTQGARIKPSTAAVACPSVFGTALAPPPPHLLGTHTRTHTHTHIHAQGVKGCSFTTYTGAMGLPLFHPRMPVTHCQDQLLGMHGAPWPIKSGKGYSATANTGAKASLFRPASPSHIVKINYKECKGGLYCINDTDGRCKQYYYNCLTHRTHRQARCTPKSHVRRTTGTAPSQAAA